MENMNLGNRSGDTSYEQNINTSAQQLPLSSLIGSSIINRQGDTLGKLHDIIVDIKEGKIGYVVIEFGGFLGLNQKYFTLAFDALSLAKEHRNAFIINETKESVKRFLSFDKEHLPYTHLSHSKTDG
jgi:sporulation protein YlmC with PRC-barrel domain